MNEERTAIIVFILKLIVIIPIPFIVILIVGTLLFDEATTMSDLRTIVVLVFAIALYYPLLKWLGPIEGA